jgi:hypothetical protein
MPRDPHPKDENSLKAGALLCPVCCVEFQEIQVDMEWEGKVLRNVKLLRCPVCHEEQFPPESNDYQMGTKEDSGS